MCGPSQKGKKKGGRCDRVANQEHHPASSDGSKIAAGKSSGKERGPALCTSRTSEKEGLKGKVKSTSESWASC